jgi:hypothetical protein
VMLGQENFLTPICIVEMNGTYAIDLYHAITRHPVRKKGRGRPRFQLPRGFESSEHEVFSLCRSGLGWASFRSCFLLGPDWLNISLDRWVVAWWAIKETLTNICFPHKKNICLEHLQEYPIFSSQKHEVL